MLLFFFAYSFKESRLKLRIGLSVFTLTLIALIYWQGVTGLFMLDDVANLQLLYDQISEEGFWAGVLGGSSGPTGRPVSLLSFALQQSSWPDDPLGFKFVNIIIHLISSALMASIIYWLLPHLFSISNNHRFSIAILLSAFWALLPIQISTVLYVVQRMVLLSSLFMLLAIVFYAWARAELCRHRLSRASVIFCLGVGISSLLAILSKESGLLVFAFLLTVEILVQQKQPLQSTKIRFWILVSLAFPLVLFVAYIIYKGNYQNYEGRTFNLIERLLTQPRVLLDYVQQIILPVQSQLGLYHDDYVKSTGLLNPISTLWAIVFWIVFAVIAIWGKFASKPWLFFAFFWFISGHLMESTVLPLELYFEHRNYLSSMGILIGCMGLFLIFYGLIKSKSIQNIVRLCGIIYPFLIISVTVSHATLWGNKGEYMVVSAMEHPTSLRARMLMIDYYDAVGLSNQAYTEIDKMLEDFPGEISLRLNKMLYACDNGYDLAGVEVSNAQLTTGRFSHATERVLLKLINHRKEDACDKLGYDQLLTIVNGLIENKNYSKVKERMLRIRSAIYFHNKDYAKSINFLEGLPNRNFSDNIGLILAYAYTGDHQKANKLKAELENDADLKEFQRKQLSELKLP
jgi:protein O-mannosyl-transferase